MESLEQSSSHSKRKLTAAEDDREHFYSFDIEHEQSTKLFCCRSPTSSSSSSSTKTSTTNNNHHALANYQQTTKIIQEFNIQQSTSTSDITVSSTINIKSTPKPQMKSSSSDLLSEADFQRVVQDITPADRDLFDEFLNGIKQKTEDYLFLSTFDDLPSSSSSSSSPASHEQNSATRRHSSLSLPSQTSSMMSSDRRRNSIPRGSSTIHYSPHAIPISNRPPTAAAQTLKQMAVQHQQRIIYNQQHQQQIASFSYNSPTQQYYPQTASTSESDNSIDITPYYQPVCYSPVQQATMSGYNRQQHSQHRANIYGIQNYSHQTSSSFYHPPQQQQQQISTSSYPIVNYPPSNGTSTTINTLPQPSFYPQEDNLPILDL